MKLFDETWRAAWATYANKALESVGRPERIEHRSYKRQGIDKIPSVHLGVAATQMEKRGIPNRKGNLNRQIAADNRLLKEIKARITRLYIWSKEQAERPEGKESILLQLWQARQEMDSPDSRYEKIKDLKEQAAFYSLLQGGGITTMRQLHEKISAMNKSYYDLRGKIVSAERRIKVLDEHLSMWEQYEKNKGIRRPLSGKTEIRRGGSHPEEMGSGITFHSGPCLHRKKYRTGKHPIRRVKIIFRTDRCATRSGIGSTPEHHPQCGR